MNLHLLNSLIRSTVRNDEELDQLRFASTAALMAAIGRLGAAGLTPSQLQWLVGKRFSLFGDNECLGTLLLDLAIERRTLSVEALHTKLRNDEIRARLHHHTHLFATDPLPDFAAIDRSLGLAPAGAPIALAGRNQNPALEANADDRLTC